MPKRKKSASKGINVSEDTVQKAILARIGEKAIENVGELVALAGIYYLSHDYWRAHPEALQQTAITWLLFKSGTELGITAALGGIALRDFMKKVPEFNWEEGLMDEFKPQREFRPSSYVQNQKVTSKPSPIRWDKDLGRYVNTETGVTQPEGYSPLGWIK